MATADGVDRDKIGSEPGSVNSGSNPERLTRDGLKLVCLPFDTADPRGSASHAMHVLEGSQ